MSHYGCHSQPRASGYWARNGTFVNERIEVVQNAVFISDTMSRECRYDRQREDAKCEGCSRITTNDN